MKTKLALTSALVAVMSTTPALADVHADKVAFISQVDESISGDRIAGNPYKFVGKRVELHCTVASIPDQNAINATCGESNIVIVVRSAADLEQGQDIRVLGVVAKPAQGTNLFGGSREFPTVLALYME